MLLPPLLFELIFLGAHVLLLLQLNAVLFSLNQLNAVCAHTFFVTKHTHTHTHTHTHARTHTRTHIP